MLQHENIDNNNNDYTTYKERILYYLLILLSHDRRLLFFKLTVLLQYCSPVSYIAQQVDDYVDRLLAFLIHQATMMMKTCRCY